MYGGTLCTRLSVCTVRSWGRRHNEAALPFARDRFTFIGNGRVRLYAIRDEKSEKMMWGARETDARGSMHTAV